MERSDQTLAALRREGADEHAADTAKLIAEAQGIGQISGEYDALLLATGVVATVAYFGHHHRRGRISLDVDDLARFVGQWVVQALAGHVPAPVPR